ncbi:hypothetical protein [Helicobacter suis]|uniref:hypothetical protein n=1 Tax=Helicobacter suis TaxID=104628 RepID=UPI0013D25CE9|nr:hypothetical protein [Helicobacter suis]
MRSFVCKLRFILFYELNDKLDKQLARLKYETYQLRLTQIVQDCVENKEHKQICYTLLQQAHLIIDFNPAVASTIDSYLKLLQPAKLDHLIRVGGKSDGGVCDA